jgi:hypothetical protein
VDLQERKKEPIMRVKNLVVSAAILVVMSCCLPLASAEIMTGDLVKVTGFNPMNNAGIIKLQDISQGFTIETFCIEKNIHIPYQTAVEVETITKQGYAAGPLAIGVDYLFYQFTTGFFNVLPDSRGNIHTSFQEQLFLQDVIWGLQGQLPAIPNSWLNVADGHNYYYMLAVANANLQSDWGTLVLNLVDRQKSPVQNMLYQIPVPEPSTLILLGLGLGAATLIRRKR